MSEAEQPAPRMQQAPRSFDRKKGLVTSIYLTKDTRNKLRSLKKELGFRTYDVALGYMTQKSPKEGRFHRSSSSSSSRTIGR